MSTAAPANAPCAVHPEQTSAFICERCGAFACDACRADPGGTLCQACEARRSAEFGVPLRVGETLAAGFRLPGESVPAVAAYMGLSLIPHVLWAAASQWLIATPNLDGLNDQVTKWAQDPNRSFEVLMDLVRPLMPIVTESLVVSFVGWSCWLVATGGLTLAIARGVRGRPISTGQAFAQAARRAPALLVANLIVVILSAIGTVLCLLPGIAALLAGSLIDPAVVIGRHGPFSAYGVSARRTWRALGPVLLLVVITAALGLVASMGVNPLWGKLFTGHASSWGEVPSHLVTYATSLPLIAGVAYVYVRMDSSART